VPWDLDRTFGDHWSQSFDETALPLALGTAELPGPTGWNRLYDKFFKEPALRARLLDRLEALLQNEFTREKLFPLIERWEAGIRADVELDRRRWPTRQNDLRAGVAELKRYIDERRTYLLRAVTKERARR